MTTPDIAQRVEAVRRFNRFYTKQIGVVTDRYLKSPFSLTESRVIYELAHHEQTTATQLGGELDLDPGQLSRILHDLMGRGLIDRQPSPADGRQRILQLTQAGQEAFALLNARSHSGIEAMLGKLRLTEQDCLVESMKVIEALLGVQPEHRVPYILRPPQAGDMGWVVQRHGVLYAEAYGWNEQFEALVAEIVAKFVQNFDPQRERCWIAERDGEAIGSVFLVKKSATVAKLRLLLVEPKARGLGVGTRLVDECVRFARSAGYKKIWLWTNSVLVAARYIYAKAGFRLIEEEPHHSFGHDLVGETWELKL